MNNKKTIFVFIFIWTVSFFAYAKDIKLSEIRLQLISQDVVIVTPKYDSGRDGTLLGWMEVYGPDKGYSKKTNLVSGSLQGVNASIVSVEERKSSSTSERPKSDIFGHPLPAYDPIDPPLRVVVKISGEDKWLATEGGYDALQKTAFRLVAQMNFMQSEVEAKLQKIIGKTVFSTALTDLLKTDFSSADLARPLTRHLSRVATPNLTPIKIVEAVYLPNVNAVALKVSTGDGEDRLLWGDMSLYNIKNSDMTFL